MQKNRGSEGLRQLEESMGRLLGIAAVILSLVGGLLLFQNRTQQSNNKAAIMSPEVKLIRACGEELNLRIAIFTEAQDVATRAFQEMEAQVKSMKPTEEALRAYVEAARKTYARYSDGLNNLNKCVGFVGIIGERISAKESELALNYLEAARRLLLTFDTQTRARHEVVDKACMMLYKEHAPPLPPTPAISEPPRPRSQGPLALAVWPSSNFEDGRFFKIKKARLFRRASFIGI